MIKTANMDGIRLDPSCMLLDTYRVYLGAGFLAEIQKKGTKVGIYTLTATGRKRGVVLPVEVWRTLDSSRDIIKTAIDICDGSIHTYQNGYTTPFTHQPIGEGRIVGSQPQETYVYGASGEIGIPGTYPLPCNIIAESFYAASNEETLHLPDSLLQRY